MKREYKLPYTIRYYSKRYDKHVIVEEGFESDGATGAFDIWSEAWWVHDKICETGKWSDGTSVTNWQASTVLADILDSEQRYFRARYWWVMTWLLGCEKARENGMW